VAVWFDSNLFESPDALLSKQALRDAYNRNVEASGRFPLSEKAVGQMLHRLRPHIKHAQRTVNGEVKWVWVGIGLRPDSQSG
jgi:hypothetical protein